MIEQPKDNEQRKERMSFLPVPPPPYYEPELFLRMLDKETIVVIDEVSGNQVLVFESKP